MISARYPINIALETRCSTDEARTLRVPVSGEGWRQASATYLYLWELDIPEMVGHQPELDEPEFYLDFKQ